jgi:transketolase
MIEFNSLNTRTWSKLGQRGTLFGVAALEIGAVRDDFIILTADLATLSGIDRFKRSYPDMFFNIGIAEQNMLGIAAGLANEGKMVFVTTYATFISMRSFEQVRHYLGYMNSNVKVIGSGAGLAMGVSGNTHYSIEDLALMRSIPGLVVLSPADAGEALKAAFAAVEYKGPIYLRLTGALNCPIVYKDDYHFEIGKAITLKDGTDITIIATGTMVYNSLQAAESLERDGISTAVIDMHTIKPLDTAVIAEACKRSKLIVTVEEHSVIGGLGGAVAEYKSAQQTTPPQLIIGIADRFRKAGDYRYMLSENGLLPEQLATQIRQRYRSL